GERASGENEGLDIGRDDLRQGIVGQDLAIDLQLADAAGDQLRVLRAEIKDDDFFLHQGCGIVGSSSLYTVRVEGHWPSCHSSIRPRPSLRIFPSSVSDFIRLSRIPLTKSLLFGVLYSLAISTYSSSVTLVGMVGKNINSVSAILIIMTSRTARRSISQFFTVGSMRFSRSSACSIVIARSLFPKPSTVSSSGLYSPKV